MSKIRNNIIKTYIHSPFANVLISLRVILLTFERINVNNFKALLNEYPIFPFLSCNIKFYFKKNSLNL